MGRCPPLTRDHFGGKGGPEAAQRRLQAGVEDVQRQESAPAWRATLGPQEGTGSAASRPQVTAGGTGY